MKNLHIKYKFSADQRTCKQCKKYPCIKNQQKLKLDYARLGCVDYAKLEKQ